MSALQRCLHYCHNSSIRTSKGQSQVSALQRCLHYCHTSIRISKRQSQVSTLQRCLYYCHTSSIRDIKGTEPSVCITEVSVLQLLNKVIKATEPSVHITEVSVLLSQLPIRISKRQSQVSTFQWCLYYCHNSSIR